MRYWKNPIPVFSELPCYGGDKDEGEGVEVDYSCPKNDCKNDCKNAEMETILQISIPNNPRNWTWKALEAGESKNPT